MLYVLQKKLKTQTRMIPRALLLALMTVKMNGADIVVYCFLCFCDTLLEYNKLLGEGYPNRKDTSYLAVQGLLIQASLTSSKI